MINSFGHEHKIIKSSEKLQNCAASSEFQIYQNGKSSLVTTKWKFWKEQNPYLASLICLKYITLRLDLFVCRAKFYIELFIQMGMTFGYMILFSGVNCVHYGFYAYILGIMRDLSHTIDRMLENNDSTKIKMILKEAVQLHVQMNK